MDTTANPLESQLFTWEEWDQIDTMSFLFMKCKTVTQLGPYAPDTLLQSITMNYDKGTIEVWEAPDAHKPAWSGELLLQVKS